MTALYGYTWASAHGASAVNPETDRLTIDGETWQRALAGLSGQQFGAGLDACITEGGEFPPSAPRFRAMCLGIPTFARVRLEATQANAVRSPFTRFVLGYVDGYALRQADMRAADTLLRAAYDVALEARMQGAELPAQTVDLPAPSAGRPAAPKPASPDVAAQHMADIISLFDDIPPPAPLAAPPAAAEGGTGYDETAFAGPLADDAAAVLERQA